MATGAGAESTADKANRVENLTINDMDSEANTVGISGNDATAASLTGTLTLTGGTAGKGYTVSSTLHAAFLSFRASRSGPASFASYSTRVMSSTVSRREIR